MVEVGWAATVPVAEVLPGTARPPAMSSSGVCGCSFPSAELAPTKLGRGLLKCGHDGGQELSFRAALL